MNQQDIIDSLPVHLRSFVTTQDYSAYTARDHAVWRFLMHQLRFQLVDTAHPVYLEGLRRTGISIEHIPSIDEMNHCLADIGWRALGVDGFIPPAIFMEFQSLRILVIAMNMRTIDQMLYTPAPDILHESAGHASFLVDVDYAEFLQQFGEIGMRALCSREDEEVYEAIRHLSIVKENPQATPEEVRHAEARLEEVTARNPGDSEAALLARLHWWTVEYGLVGDLDEYRIFGAGLLSSLGESRHCLDDEKVTKHLLTPDAINQPYDITTEQPQLYVTHSCRHLSQVLDDVANGMAQRRGGADAVRAAARCKTVATLEYSSGLQVSGVVLEPMTDAMDNLTYIRTTGKSQLAWNGEELPGHGTGFHSAGFGSPTGHVNEFSRCLSEYSIDELRFAGIETGKPVTLEFVSGITVQGELLSILRRDQKNILLSFRKCRVTSATGEILFDPDWGQYDMAVGTRIVSVCGGSADPARFPLYRAPAEKSSARIWNANDRALFSVYHKLRQLRETGNPAMEDLRHVQAEIMERYPDEWLLLFELWELFFQACDETANEVLDVLRTLVRGDAEIDQLVDQGIHRVRTDAGQCTGNTASRCPE